MVAMQSVAESFGMPWCVIGRYDCAGSGEGGRVRLELGLKAALKVPVVREAPRPLWPPLMVAHVSLVNLGPTSSSTLTWGATYEQADENDGQHVTFHNDVHGVRDVRELHNVVLSRRYT